MTAEIAPDYLLLYATIKHYRLVFHNEWSFGCIRPSQSSHSLQYFWTDNLYVSESGDLVENVPSAFQALAAAFIPDQSGALEGVDLGMSEALAGPASVALFADKNDSPDSANEFRLGSVTSTKPLEPDNNSVLSLTYGGSPLMLRAGTLYWIGVQAPSIPTTDYWNFATPGHTGTVAISADGLNWNVTSGQGQFAFDVLANTPNGQRGTGQDEKESERRRMELGSRMQEV